MPSLKPGQKQYQIILEEGSQTHTTLLEWAKARGLTPGKATRCILTDWSDALNGKPNPFAIAIAAAAGVTLSTGPGQATQMPVQEPAMSAEEQARQVALLEAAEQFM
jgi:hypothetical protein